jgi:hypothetical protein
MTPFAATMARGICGRNKNADAARNDQERDDSMRQIVWRIGAASTRRFVPPHPMRKAQSQCLADVRAAS